MELNFKENKYNEKALTIKLEEKSIHSPEEAFFLLINGYDYESLNNLCTFISRYYYLDEEESYQLTQDLNLDKENKKIIMNLAKDCIKLGMSLGNKLVCNGKFEATSWISHCMYVGEVCETLANAKGLNKDIALTLGLLHDYGRRIDQSFKHVIVGFQELTDLGWNNEALSCLTHSFLNGGRCANNEPAESGFYVDDEGNPQWEFGTKKDDITTFLENYQYTEYDTILNIADLMATSNGIVSPYERIEDIATRRTIDPTNRGYFLAELTNTLIDFLKKTNHLKEDFPYIKATKATTLKEIEMSFKVVSLCFYNTYLEISTDNKKIFSLEPKKKEENTPHIIKKLRQSNK